jgi:putative selenium metabolism hydrolase
MDIKGPLAIQTHAAAAFVASRPSTDIYVAHTVLEERGGWGMEYLMQNGEVKPAAVIIGEATAGDICIGHRGRAEIVVEVEGRAGHASAPERADNPIALLARLIPVIEQFAAGLGADPILGPSTLTPTEIETLPRSRNVIPDRIRIVLDWRVLPDLTREAAVDAVRTAIASGLPDPAPYQVHVRFSTEMQHTFTGMERERLMFTPGFLLSPDHPVVRAAVRSVAASTGRTPRARPWTFATDGGHTCGVHGVPTIGYAPGEERFAHTNRERLALDDAERAFGAYPDLIRAVAAVA